MTQLDREGGGVLKSPAACPVAEGRRRDHVQRRRADVQRRRLTLCWKQSRREDKDTFSDSEGLLKVKPTTCSNDGGVIPPDVPVRPPTCVVARFGRFRQPQLLVHFVSQSFLSGEKSLSPHANPLK